MMRLIGIVVTLALLGAGGVYFWKHRAGSSEKIAEATRQLALARALIDRGDVARGTSVLDQMQTRGLQAGEDGQWLRVRSAQAGGRASEAAKLASDFLRAHPQSVHAEEAELVMLAGRVATEGVASAELRKPVEDFLTAHPGLAGTSSLEVALGTQELAEGNTSSATERLERLMAASPDDSDVRAFARAVSDANTTALLNGTWQGGYTTHKISKGEAIFDIARKYRVTGELVTRVNNITDARRLRIGQELKIPVLDWSLTCDVGANELVLANAGKFFKMYEVRTGRDPGATPRGTFRILNKKRNPTWKPGNGHVYLAGDPNNELGTRWMSFKGDILGIHGTLHDETIGHYASNGCIGMRAADVEELFDFINTGTPLEIRGEQDATRHKILPKPDIAPPQQIAMK